MSSFQVNVGSSVRTEELQLVNKYDVNQDRQIDASELRAATPANEAKEVVSITTLALPKRSTISKQANDIVQKTMPQPEPVRQLDQKSSTQSRIDLSNVKFPGEQRVQEASVDQSSQRFKNVAIPSQDLFPSDFRSRLPEGGILRMSDNMFAEFERKHNAVRFYVTQGNEMNTVSFFFNEEDQVTSIIDIHGTPSPAALSEIVSAGGLKPEALQRLGYTQQDVETSRVLIEQRTDK